MIQTQCLKTCLKKMQDNLVSVIIPTYNRADLITKTLDSVWAQTYRPIEVLVVDDGSTDETKKVVTEWKRNHKASNFTTEYIYQENEGAPSARNTGIKNAKGRYLQFFDSDDLLMPEKLDLQIEKMKQEKTPICICDYIHTDHEENVIRTASNNRSLNQIITNFTWLHTSIGVIDKTLFKNEILKWNPNLKKAQDRDFNLKLFFVTEGFSYVNKPLFKWVRRETDGITNTTVNSSQAYWKNLKSLVKFSFKYFSLINLTKILPITYLYAKLFYIFVGKKMKKILLNP